MAGSVFGPAAVEQMKEIARRVLGEARGGRSDRGVPPVSDAELVEGFLDAALGPATNTLTGPTTANLSVYRGDGSGNLEDTGQTVLITNRSTSLDAVSGAYCVAGRLNGEWRPVWVDCSVRNEVQTLFSDATSGTFTLTYQGETTSAIAYNASAATIQSELEALPSIGSGNVSCSGGDLPGTAVTVEFTGELAEQDVDTLLVDNSGLSGGTVSVNVSTPGCCG